MSTTTQPLKYLWTAMFSDGTSMRQPADDKYSKHDDTAEHNPSSFRDLLEYNADVWYFILTCPDHSYGVDITGGEFSINGDIISLENEPLSNRKLIYYRDVQIDSIDGCTGEPYVVRYAIGYEGKNSKGKVEKKVIFIDGK